MCVTGTLLHHKIQHSCSTTSLSFPITFSAYLRKIIAIIFSHLTILVNVAEDEFWHPCCKEGGKEWFHCHSVTLSSEEKTMKTIRQTSRLTKIELDREVSQFIFTIISASAVLIGIWGAACLVSGMIANGIVPMIQGYISALTGL